MTRRQEVRVTRHSIYDSVVLSVSSCNSCLNSSWPASSSPPVRRGSTSIRCAISRTPPAAAWAGHWPRRRSRWGTKSSSSAGRSKSNIRPQARVVPVVSTEEMLAAAAARVRDLRRPDRRRRAVRLSPGARRVAQDRQDRPADRSAPHRNRRRRRHARREERAAAGSSASRWKPKTIASGRWPSSSGNAAT